MPEKALELASHMTNPVTVTAFTIVFLGVALWTVVKAKNKPIAWLLTSGLILVGVIPIVASTYLSARGVYRLRVTVLSPDNQPVTNAEVEAPAGEKQQTESGWVFEISPQTKPSDNKVTVYASLPDSFLSGSATAELAKDYFPTLEVHLKERPPVEIHGEVLDERQKGVPGADVLLPDCSLSTKTDDHGLFHLNSCKAAAQMLSIRAEKNGKSGSKMIIAGETAQVTIQ